jgi:hypothetical protein
MSALKNVVPNKSRPKNLLCNRINWISRIEGKRKRERGRPKTTWRRTIENEIKERGYTWGTIDRKANNREE